MINAKALFDEDVLRKVRGGRPARSKALDLGSRLEGVHGFESHPPHLFFRKKYIQLILLLNYEKRGD